MSSWFSQMWPRRLDFPLSFSLLFGVFRCYIEDKWLNQLVRATRAQSLALTTLVILEGCTLEPKEAPMERMLG